MLTMMRHVGVHAKEEKHNLILWMFISQIHLILDICKLYVVI
jgi:hypothetical protein